MSLSRRTFLGTMAVPLMPSLAYGQALGGQPAQFAAILHQIGGLADISPHLIRAADHELEQAYGSQARSRLVRALGRGVLKERLAQADEPIKEQVRFLARLLYTGEITRNGRTQAIYYPWCLAWRALSFATTPGLCAGPGFGHWADAPEQEH